MFRLAWKLVKLAVVLPLVLVGVGTTAWYTSRYQGISFKLFDGILDGKPILRVFEVQKSGSTYTAKRYAIKDSTLILTRLQGVDIDSLVEVGESRRIPLTPIQRETLIDIAMMVEPIKVRDPRQDEEEHFVSMCFGDDKFYTTVPEQQRSAAVLARALERFSRSDLGVQP